MPSTPSEDSAPAATLDRSKAQAAPTHNPVRRLYRGVPWPHEPASGCAKLEGFPPSTTRHTGDLCAPSAVAGDVRRCLQAVAPLAAAAPLMPAPGPADAPLAAGCGGGAWGERWWAMRMAQAEDGALGPEDAAACAAGPPRVAAAAAAAATPWYAFARGPVLFVALSSAHPTGRDSEQARFARRAAKRRPPGGWLVAYAHGGGGGGGGGPGGGGGGGGGAMDALLGALKPDLLLAAGGCASSTPPKHGVGGSCVSPPPEGYMRLRVLSKGGQGRKAAALRVEQVRATDGQVLGAFEVASTPVRLNNT